MKKLDEIYEQVDKASEARNKGSRFGGMSYEDGIIAALEWAVGDSEVKPMDE